MKFALSQILGLIGDTLEFWGQGLQNKSANMVTETLGLRGDESFSERLVAIRSYLDTGRKVS